VECPYLSITKSLGLPGYKNSTKLNAVVALLGSSCAAGFVPVAHQGWRLRNGTRTHSIEPAAAALCASVTGPADLRVGKHRGRRA
jgi:hypothetical protein